jgi:hypothetical protein
MFEYYGLDWALLTFGLASKYLLIKQNRLTFITSIIACSAGLAVSIMSNQHGISVFNLILIGMSVKGYIHWGKLERERQQLAQSQTVAM